VACVGRPLIVLRRFNRVFPDVKVLHRYVARAAYCFIRSLNRFWTILLGYEPKPVRYSRV
jgi:hypothetical protein